MSNMQVFYQKIQASTAESSNPYQSTLAKLAQIDVAYMKALVTDLWWTDWDPSPSEPAES